MERSPKKFGAGDAVFENFGQIFEKLWLKNATKVDLQKLEEKVVAID